MNSFQDDDKKILLNDHNSSLAESVRMGKKSQVGIYVQQQSDDKINETPKVALLNQKKKRPQTGHGILNDNLDGEGPNGKSIFQESNDESSYEGQEEKLEEVASLNGQIENNFEISSINLLENPKSIPILGPEITPKNGVNFGSNTYPRKSVMMPSIDLCKPQEFGWKDVVKACISNFKDSKILLEECNQQISKQNRRESLYFENDENSKNSILDEVQNLIKLAKDVVAHDKKFYEEIDILKDYQYMPSTSDVLEIKTGKKASKKNKKKNIDFFNGNSKQENDANVFFNLNQDDSYQNYERSNSVASLQNLEQEQDQDDEKTKEQSDQLNGDLHLAVVIDQKFEIKPSDSEIQYYQLEIQAKHEKETEEAARKLEEEKKAESPTRLQLDQSESDTESKIQVEENMLKNCRLRRLLKYRLKDDQFRLIDETLLECSTNKLGMSDWEYKHHLSHTNFDIVLHNNSTYFFYPVAPQVVEEEPKADIQSNSSKSESKNNSRSSSPQNLEPDQLLVPITRESKKSVSFSSPQNKIVSPKNILSLNLPLIEENKNKTKDNEQEGLIKQTKEDEKEQLNEKPDHPQIDFITKQQKDISKINQEISINQEHNQITTSQDLKLLKDPKPLSDTQKEGGSLEKSQSIRKLQRNFTQNLLQKIDQIEMDDTPQMTLQLYKHIAWPEIIPNCYSESQIAQDWIQQHQGSQLFKMEQYQLRIPKRWPLRQPELGVMGLQVLFLINPENLDSSDLRERDYEFLDQQYVVVRQKATENNWQSDNLLVYSLKEPEKPLIQIEELISFGVIQAGFVFKIGEKGELSFIFQCSTIGASYTCQVQYFPGQTVKDASKVKKYNINLIQFANVNALRRPNQIQTRTVLHQNEQGAEKEVKTTFYLGGFNDITDPVVLNPLFEEQNDRDRLKSAITSSYPIKKDLKIISFTSAKDGGFPIVDDGKLNQLLRHITPPEIRKDLCDKIGFGSLHLWDIVICSNNRIVLINQSNVLQWWIKDTLVTSLKNKIQNQSPLDEDEQLFIPGLEEDRQYEINLETYETYNVVLQQFNNQNKLKRLQLQRNENNNINKNLTLGRVHKGVIYGHHDLWIIKSKPSQSDYIPCLSVDDNFLLLDLEQNQNGFLSMIRLFPDDQLDPKYGIRLLKFQVSHQAGRAIFFFEKRPGFSDQNNTNRNIGIVFFISETISRLKEIAEKLKKSKGNRAIQNSESLLQKSTIVFIMLNFKDLRFFKYDDGIKNFNAIFENQKKTQIQPDEYLGLLNHTEFEPITDCNQPSTSEMVIPFYFNDYDPNEGRMPFLCFFNILKFGDLCQAKKIPSPTDSDCCETRRFKNWFIEQGVIQILKVSFYQKTLEPNLEAEIKFYQDRSHVDHIKRPRMITRSSPWAFNTIKVGDNKQKVWQATFQLGLQLCKSDYSVREYIVNLSDQCQPIFDMSQEQCKILGFQKQNQQEKSFVFLQATKITLVARTQQTDNLPSNLYCNDILLPQFNDEGVITSTNIIICTSFSGSLPQKCIAIENNLESIEFPDEKTKLKMIAWYENNLLNHPVIVNSINEDKTVKDNYLDSKIWNKVLQKNTQQVFVNYEIVPLGFDKMNRFSTKIQQGGYKHIRFTDSFKKQISIVSANLTKDIILNEAFEESEQAYLIFHTLRQILSMSEANFGDFYTYINSQEKEMASHLFQPRFIHAGLSLCTIELKNMLKNTSILYNALNWDPNSQDFKQDKYTYLRNSVVSQFANFENYVVPYNLNRFFDFQSGFNYQTLIQLSIDSNMLKPAIVIVDFLMQQKESIDITFQTVMTDFPQLLSNDKIDIIPFLNHNEENSYQIQDQGQGGGVKQIQANLIIDLISDSLPALGAPENEYMKCKIDTLFNPIPQCVDALLNEIEKAEKEKSAEVTEVNSSDIRVEFNAMIFLHTNIKMKIDVFTKREASDDTYTDYLDNKYWKDLNQVAVSDLFMAELIANQESPEFFTSRAIKAIIVKQFDKKSGAYVVFFCYFYLLGFVLTYSLTILLRASYEHAEDNVEVSFVIRVLTIISLITQIIFFLLEVIEMMHKDLANYFLDPWNYSDCLQIFFFLAHEGLRLTYPNINVNLQAKATDGLLQVFTLIQVFLKVLQFMRSFKTFQPLIQMQVQVFSDIKPFLLIFFLLIYTFSLITFALDADFKNEDFPGLPRVFYTIIRIFRNSIGDIEVPLYDNWLNDSTDPETNEVTKIITGSAEGISIFVIYLYWIFNIFIMVIILLNFLIAEVGGTFEAVKEEAEPLQYKNKSEQNLLIYKLDKIFRKPVPAQVWLFKTPVQSDEQKSEIKVLQSNVLNLIQSSSKNLEKEINQQIKSSRTISDSLTSQLSDNLETFKKNMEEKIQKIEIGLQNKLELIDQRMVDQDQMLKNQFIELQKAMIEAMKTEINEVNKNHFTQQKKIN